MKISNWLAVPVIACVQPLGAEPVTLGTFTFDSALFGDRLVQSDGGSLASTSWLNVVNTDPFSPAYLTGANFNTGIANIGHTGARVTYTIRYDTGILNVSGTDLGIVAARFSSDPFDIALATNGASFTSAVTVPASAAIATGVDRSYYFQGRLYTAELWVYPIDFTTFGLSANAVVRAVALTGYTELDLIRAAGVTPIPEPDRYVLMLAGTIAISYVVRRTKPRSSSRQ